MDEREYIIVKRPSTPFLTDTELLRMMDDDFWKRWIFYHLLSFYKNYNSVELKDKIKIEQTKQYPRTEREIAKYIRSYLRNTREFNFHFDVAGELTNDGEVEGNYDISIKNTYWNKNFFFECKNLSTNQRLINEYVFVSSKKDGGVYRYFNGKYAQGQNFGGMLGFVLSGDILKIKEKIIEKMKLNFDISPEGDLKQIFDNSIEGHSFTFDSIHNRLNSNFMLHHLLFNLSN